MKMKVDGLRFFEWIYKLVLVIAYAIVRVIYCSHLAIRVIPAPLLRPGRGLTYAAYVYRATGNNTINR